MPHLSGSSVKNVPLSNLLEVRLIWTYCSASDPSSVLECGPGKGLTGYFLRHYTRASYLVGLEVWDPYVEVLEESKIYNKVLKWDLNNTPLPFQGRVFDLAICSEVLEHLTHNNAIKLIEELKRVSRRVCISTPGYYFHNSSLDGNVHQKHLSLISQRDLQKQGFRVWGYGNFIINGRELRKISTLLTPLTPKFPKFAQGLFATWESS
jgi:SAM-dependent methyltransferase